MTQCLTRAIFWDNDGVLVDTEHLYFLATRDALATVGVSLSEEQYIELFLVEGRGAWHLAADRGITPEAIATLRRVRDSCYEGMLRRETLVMPGVREVLDALHGRYLMGIVTSSEPEHFALIHERTGLLPYFRFALTAGDYARSKPHPDPYLKAIDRSGCGPEECLVIEDSERGLKAAKAAGLRCVVVPSGLTRGRAFEGAERVVERLADVAEALA